MTDSVGGLSALVVAGGILAAASFLLFRRRRRGRVAQAGASASGPLADADQQALLDLLHQLVQWTQGYSGNVADHQQRLSELSEQFQREAANLKSPAARRAVSVLGDIVQNNQQLCQRLDAAERQLDRHARQIESYLAEARTDSLTGLANRRSFDARLEEMFNNFRRGGVSFALAMVDIDHFKKINDTHGHQAGDEVLRQIAVAFRHGFDDAHLLARYGGEEFALLLHCPLRAATGKVDALRKQLARQPIETDVGRLRVTLSAGLAEPHQESVATQLVRRADEALYMAKQMGRDRVYYHDGQHPVLLGAPEPARR